MGTELNGTPEQPIVIRARSGEAVIVDGGACFVPEGLTAVTDPEERSRPARTALDRIRVKAIKHPALLLLWAA